MSDVSLEELLRTLQAAEEAEKEEKPKPVHKDVAHMDRFIEDMDVKVGTDRVPNYIIYYYYKKIWPAMRTDNKKAKIPFFRTFNKKFPSARDGRQRYYMLDGSAFDLTREGKLKAKHYDEKYKERIKKKQSKKSKSAKKVQSKE